MGAALSVVEVYADVACPFAYVLLDQLVRRRADMGVVDRPIVVRAWPLERINDRPHDAAYVAAEVAALRASVAPHLFAGFDPERMPPSTLAPLALVAALNARGPEVGEPVAMRQRELLYEEGIDVSDPVVLGALEASYGLHVEPDPSLVDAEWDLGRHRGVKGSPHVFVDDVSEFCPTFTVERDGADFRIAPTPWADDFLAACFR